MARFGVALIGLLTFISISSAADIRNLIGEPDYRQVRLRWETENNSTDPFQIKYCELQSWGPQRCKIQKVLDPIEEKSLERREKTKIFTQDVKGLRMATTYSFEIRNAKEGRANRARGDDRNDNVIVIPTKGFSARATQCLPQASEIEVATGPYFAGRIAVEVTDGERCAIDGDPTSSKDTYTLRIDHAECGSQVNETTVATFVIVQENLPILTHSTRRFLVICSYQPETLTVRAGLNLPTSKGQAQLSPVTFEEESSNQLGRRGRNIKIGKLLRAEPLVQEDINEVHKSGSNNLVPLLVMCVLSIAILIGIFFVVFKITNKKSEPSFDNVSVISDFSVSSYVTTESEFSIQSQSKNM